MTVCRAYRAGRLVTPAFMEKGLRMVGELTDESNKRSIPDKKVVKRRRGSGVYAL